MLEFFKRLLLAPEIQVQIINIHLIYHQVS